MRRYQSSQDVASQYHSEQGKGWAGALIFTIIMVIILGVLMINHRHGGHYVLGPNYDIRYDGCWHAADSYTEIPGGVTYTRGERETTWYGPYGVEQRK